MGRRLVLVWLINRLGALAHRWRLALLYRLELFLERFGFALGFCGLSLGLVDLLLCLAELAVRVSCCRRCRSGLGWWGRSGFAFGLSGGWSLGLFYGGLVRWRCFLDKRRMACCRRAGLRAPRQHRSSSAKAPPCRKRPAQQLLRRRRR